MSEPNWNEVHYLLSAPFPADAVHWRVGSTTADKSRGMALAYIDARDVMDRLDQVCGPGNWQSRFVDAAGRIICELTVFGVTKSDGAGDTDVEPEKGGISDALKRAAVQFGIGRYLYRLDSPWVALAPAGKSYKIAPGQEGLLRKALDGGAATIPTSTAAVPPHIAEDPFGSRPTDKPTRPTAPAPSAQPQPDEGEFFFSVGSPEPEQPTYGKWASDVIKSGKMAGRAWGEMSEGSFGGQRYKWLASIATWDEAAAGTKMRALWCLWRIEQAERIERDANKGEF